MATEKGSVAMQEKESEKVEVPERGRRERVPLGARRMKLNVSKAMLKYFDGRNEVVRWINDEPGRLEAATQEDSYRFVTKREFPSVYKIEVGEGDDPTQRDGIDSRVCRVVGKKDSGQPITAYLMAKPREDYEADQMERAGMINKREDAMRQGVDGYGRPGDSEGRYIPSPGIKITHS